MKTGKFYDPVFLFMLFAVMLAIGSSFALRAVIAGTGPSSANAAETLPDGTTVNAELDRIPPPSTRAITSAKNALQK